MISIKDKEYKKIVKDILRNKDFKALSNIEHHGISRYEHLVKISYKSYKIAKRCKLDYKSVARGALLHDFYLDGNERTQYERLSDTFIHPRKALKTSIDNFDLNNIEKNIIISHMFPMFPVLPKYKESILVNMVDKIIGAPELIRKQHYKFKYQFNYLFVLFLVVVISE